MRSHKLVPVHINDPQAINLVRERAQKENRSLANAAATTIIESLGKKREPGQARFIDDIISKYSIGQEQKTGET